MSIPSSVLTVGGALLVELGSVVLSDELLFIPYQEESSASTSEATLEAAAAFVSIDQDTSLDKGSVYHAARL